MGHRFRFAAGGRGPALQRGQLEVAEELDLALQGDAELLVCAASRLDHQRDRVRRSRARRRSR